MDSDKARELLDDMLAAKDYSSDVQLKKLVNDTFRNGAEAFDRIRGFASNYGLRGSVAKKRKNAILNNMDRARKEFGRLPVNSIEESFTEFETYSFETYMYIDEMCSIVAGAAIWILDQLKKSGRMHEAFDYMPSESGEIYAVDIPFGIEHPAYELELILSVSLMIVTRNSGRCLTDTGKRDENFDRLLGLIDKEKLDHACRVFEEKQWDIIGRAMRLAAFFDEEENKILRKLRNNYEVSPLMASGEPPLSREETDDLAERADNLRRKHRWIEHEMADYLYMPRKELVKAVGNRYAADILQGFTVDDPYELCMALVLLLDNGSDAPWLMNSGTTLMLYAAEMLPWYPYYEDEDPDAEDDNFEEDDTESEEVFAGGHFNRNDWISQPEEPELIDAYHTRFGGENIAQIVYRLSGGVLPFRMHPFAKERREMIEQGMDEYTADKIESMSELFYFRDFRSGAVNLRRNWFNSFDVEDDGTEDDGSGQETEDISAEPDADAAAELEKARKEIKNLRRALSEANREANSQKAKYEKELKTLRQEHRELADLREIVFNKERSEPEEKTGSQITFPYELKKRTIIFGGHDSFLKTLKKLIPDAKYVDPGNYTFSPEIIRNADVVWVQNNCISHTQYGRVLDITRRYGIQLRYFTYASAEKSAEQIAEADRK